MQTAFIDFDHHLRITPAGFADAGDVALGQQVGFQFGPEHLQGMAIHIAVELNPERVFFPLAFGYHRIFGVSGKAGNTIHRGTHVAHQFVEVVAVLAFNRNRGTGRAGGGGDRFHPQHPLQGFFDLDGNAFFRLLGRAAVVAHRNGNRIRLKAGEGFAANIAHLEHAQCNHQQQQQVGRHRVVGEPANDAAANAIRMLRSAHQLAAPSLESLIRPLSPSATMRGLTSAPSA